VYIVESIKETLFHQDIFDFGALVLGLMYVLLMAQGRRVGWLAGILSCAIILWKDIVQYTLYADAGLQVYYIIMGGIGFGFWKRDRVAKGAFGTREWPLGRHIWIWIIGAMFSVTLGKWLSNTPAALPFIDSITTVFAILATGLMVLKLRSNWIYWMVIDAAYMYIYQRQGAYYFALLSFVYLVLSVYGYWSWKRVDSEIRVTY